MSSVRLTPITIGDTRLGDSEFCDALRQRDLHRYQATVDQVADYHLVRQACERHGIAVDDDELQDAADRWRRNHDLLSAEATQGWLGYKNLAVEDLEKNVEFGLLVEKLLDAEYGADALATKFENDVYAYTWAALSVLSVESEEQARKLADQLTANPSAFAELARKHSVEGATASAGGMLGWTSLDKIPKALQAPVRASSGNGQIVGPVESDGTWTIVQVAAIEKPAYGPEFEDTVRAGLLDDWLRKERERTEVAYPSA